MSPDLLDRAKTIGGGRLVKLLTDLDTRGITFPINFLDALKYRGVGRKSMGEMQQLGLISNCPTSELEGLSTRALNCLEIVGIKTKKEIREALESGRLTPKPAGIRSVRNYGNFTHSELCRFVGIPVVVTDTRRVRITKLLMQALKGVHPSKKFETILQVLTDNHI